MKKVYKEIITIKHNDKLFSIFLADDNRLTFLETNKEGKYFYPQLDDFIELNNIYNNRNPFICDVTKYTFKEKVKKSIVGSLLGLVVVSSTACGISHYSANIFDDALALIQDALNQKEQILITDLQQLDEILGYKSVAVDEVHRAIDANESIPYLYKVKTHLFLNIFMNKHPDWDLRIFYENIKTIDFNIVGDDYFANLGETTIGGRYVGELNQLILPESISDEYFYHELSHVFDIYFREYDDKIILRGPQSLKATTLGESMTNVVANCITTSTSYDKYGILLDYFRNYVDFDFYDYNSKGINAFASKIEESYPDVDVNFILASVDTLDIVSKEEGKYMFFDQAQGLFDELFKICTIELSKETENYYAPFAQFAKLFYYTTDGKKQSEDGYSYPETMYSYLDKYNALLKDMGYNGEIITKDKILEKVDKYKDIRYLFYKEGSVVPVIDTFSKEDEKGFLQFYITVVFEDGSKMNLLQRDYKRAHSLFSYDYFYMQVKGIEYYDIIGAPEYWKKIALDSGSLKVADLEEIPIYMNGELIANESIDNLEVTVGQGDNGEYVFFIKSKKTNFYRSFGQWNCSNSSKYVPLKTYLKNFNPADMSSLELSNIFNEEYLMDVLVDDCFFTNITIQDESLVFMPTIKIVVKEDIGISAFDLGEYFFGIEDDGVRLYPIKYTTGFEGKVYLKDILTYYNVLDEDIFEYEFTEEELMNYYENYIKDIEQENNNSMGL